MIELIYDSEGTIFQSPLHHLIAMATLLPQSIDQFRSQSYWSRFFQKRGNKSFEWYGEWKQFKRNLISYFRAFDKSAKILVIGCGNSEMSSEIYNLGFHNIYNIDFDQGVIQDMQQKYWATCPKMKWIVGDATRLLDSFNKDEIVFDIILDKGTIDAMITNTSTEVIKSIEMMMNGISQLLSSKGIYIAITLGQDHLLQIYFACLISQNALRQVEISTFQDLSHEDSVMIPFILRASKHSSSSLDYFSVDVNVPTSFQGTVNENETRSFKLPNPYVSSPHHLVGGNKNNEVDPKKTSYMEAFSQVLTCIHEIQWNFDTFRQIQSIHPDHYVQLDVFPPLSENQGGFIVTPYNTNTIINGKPSRFSVSIVDCSTSHSAAVLVVPQGREHEWLFSYREGQLQIAQDANVGRLILIFLNRGHEFVSQEEIQKEISPLILKLLPGNLSLHSIPFLAIADDIGVRTVVSEGSTINSGRFFIEDVEISNDLLVRRLVFQSNPLAVQSEVLLDKSNNSSPDHSKLMFQYHQSMARICMTLISEILLAQAALSRPLIISVFGLGGGCLAQHLASFSSSSASPLLIQAIELDPSIVTIAESFFGVKVSSRYPSMDPENVFASFSSSHVSTSSSDSVVVLEGDALDYLSVVSSSPDDSPRPHIILVDIDSKDLTNSVSFPPIAFLSKQNLRKLRLSLDQTCGSLLINFGCRSAALQAGVLAALKKEFPDPEFQVEMMSFSEEKNAILVVTPMRFKA
jgi:metal-sulfur cluster biosynthetic enzyme